MAYTSKNHYRLIYFIQEYTKLMQSKGVPNIRIYDNVKQIYPISLNTFYNYLTVNVKSELRKLDEDFERLNTLRDYIIAIIPNTAITEENFN